MTRRLNDAALQVFFRTRTDVLPYMQDTAKEDICNTIWLNFFGEKHFGKEMPGVCIEFLQREVLDISGIHAPPTPVLSRRAAICRELELWHPQKGRGSPIPVFHLERVAILDEWSRPSLVKWRQCTDILTFALSPEYYEPGYSRLVVTGTRYRKQFNKAERFYIYCNGHCPADVLQEPAVLAS